MFECHCDYWINTNLYHTIPIVVIHIITTQKCNAACFYTPIILKLLIIVQMCKKHKRGNFITIILTLHLSQLVKYWLFHVISKVQSSHFHCCSKSYRGYWPYWLASKWDQYLWRGIWTSHFLMRWFFLCNPINLLFNLTYQCAEINRWLFLHLKCAIWRC